MSAAVVSLEKLIPLDCERCASLAETDFTLHSVPYFSLSSSFSLDDLYFFVIHDNDGAESQRFSWEKIVKRKNKRQLFIRGNVKIIHTANRRIKFQNL